MSSKYATMQPFNRMPVNGTVIVHPYKPSSETKFLPQVKHMKQPMAMHQEASSLQPPKVFQQFNPHRQTHQLKPGHRLKPHQQSKEHQQSNLMSANQRSTASLELERGHDNFSEWVQTYQVALSQYCRSLVGTSWEAEDLVQETWLKVWRISLEKGQHFSINKSYLYRIANHICIDRHRRNKTVAESHLLDQTAWIESTAEEVDLDTLWMAVETIVNRLPMNQRTTLMLMDVFRYTAAETAEMLTTTEGAVKALLHRARTKLRLEREGKKAAEDSRLGKRNDSVQATPNHEQIVYAYLKAFREHNPRALLMLMNESIALDQIQPPVLQNHGELAQYRDSLKTEDYSQTYVWAAA